MTQESEVNDQHVCEECDVEMYPWSFMGEEGYACPSCGWSTDEPI